MGACLSSGQPAADAGGPLAETQRASGASAGGVDGRGARNGSDASLSPGAAPPPTAAPRSEGSLRMEAIVQKVGVTLLAAALPANTLLSAACTAPLRRPPPASRRARPAPPQVYALQQELALVSPHALLALPESAELLVEHLGVDVVGCGLSEHAAAHAVCPLSMLLRMRAHERLLACRRMHMPSCASRAACAALP